MNPPHGCSCKFKRDLCIACREPHRLLLVLSFPCRSHQELLQLPLRGIAHRIFGKFHTVIVSLHMVSRQPCFSPQSACCTEMCVLSCKMLN